MDIVSIGKELSSKYLKRILDNREEEKRQLEEVLTTDISLDNLKFEFQHEYRKLQLANETIMNKVVAVNAI